MAVERTYYTIDPEGKLTCMKCKVSCGNACLSKVWICVCSGRTRTWKSSCGGACTGG